MNAAQQDKYAPLKLHGQEYVATTWAMANMNMIIHDMEGEIEIGDTFKNPKFREGNRLQTFDRVVANPMWNQDWFKEKDYDADELGRFPKGAGFPGEQWPTGAGCSTSSPSLNDNGRAAIVLDTGAASRGSGNANKNKERDVRQWFVEQDLIEGVIYLPENLFYNTSAPGIMLFLNKAKPKDAGKIFLLNASRRSPRATRKNFIPDDGIDAHRRYLQRWREVEKYSRIVTREEMAKNDYNISPCRYIHTGDADAYRPHRGDCWRSWKRWRKMPRKPMPCFRAS